MSKETPKKANLNNFANVLLVFSKILILKNSKKNSDWYILKYN
jgi:hypothetical protein